MWREKTRMLWLLESAVGRLVLEKQRPSNVRHGHAEVDWQELTDTQKRNFQNGPNSEDDHQRVAVEASDEESCDLRQGKHS
jgi:hypothetical protein